MKLLKVFFFLILTYLFTYSSASAETRLASIIYHTVKDKVVELVLKDPANTELKKQYVAYKKKQEGIGKAFMKQALEAQKTGEMTISLKENEDQMEGFKIEKKVNDLAKDKFTSLLKEHFSKDYDVIIDGGWGNDVYYSNIAIPNLTPKFEQILSEELK